MFNEFFLFLGLLTFGVVLTLLTAVGVITIWVIRSRNETNYSAVNFVLLVLSPLESLVKFTLKCVKIDDRLVDKVIVKLRTQKYYKEFMSTTPEATAIFLPQCLRSPSCPANLLEEGIVCERCGKCEIRDAQSMALNLGYMFFVVPGSSFIKRMVKKYNPRAILGVGCLQEVKEGGEMCKKMKIPAQGLVLLQDGCVSTRLDWASFYDLLNKPKLIL